MYAPYPFHYAKTLHLDFQKRGKKEERRKSTQTSRNQTQTKMSFTKRVIKVRRGVRKKEKKHKGGYKGLGASFLLSFCLFLFFFLRITYPSTQHHALLPQSPHDDSTTPPPGPASASAVAAVAPTRSAAVSFSVPVQSRPTSS